MSVGGASSADRPRHSSACAAWKRIALRRRERGPAHRKTDVHRGLNHAVRCGGAVRAAENAQLGGKAETFVARAVLPWRAKVVRLT